MTQLHLPGAPFQPCCCSSAVLSAKHALLVAEPKSARAVTLACWHPATFTCQVQPWQQAMAGQDVICSRSECRQRRAVEHLSPGCLLGGIIHTEQLSKTSCSV